MLQNNKKKVKKYRLNDSKRPRGKQITIKYIKRV
jgi:hypothetical protein